MERSEQSKHLVYDKDNDVDNCDNDSGDGADKHLTHLIQVKNFTCVVKNTPTSLKKDVTGH
eukprot:2132693-Ditylum_brightwellii.AAC.1